ncbi:hypothetical protein HHK36_028882 [Tetracentron sinense]|uniref:C2 domain-containing protein n=1 Tax=Tetracentron sinense TaxID=13715 RepID=A0A834YC83_TETSI|nr:hypothetical protein HHK36_028882 [Tetracentron sinense]
MMHQYHQPLTLEITVISAKGLKNTSFPLLCSKPVRPFVTLSTNPPTLCRYKPIHHVYRTRVDKDGRTNPCWGDKFHLPIDTTFFSQNYSSIYLQIFSNRLLGDKIQLGWCQIPATDIIEGFRPAGSLRHLSYRVRARDGSRGHGVVNLAVRLVGPEDGPGFVFSDKPTQSDLTHFPAADTRSAAIGIPVTFPAIGGESYDASRTEEAKMVTDDLIETNHGSESCNKSTNAQWNDALRLSRSDIRGGIEVDSFNGVSSYSADR